jgi:hypothetical protein
VACSNFSPGIVRQSIIGQSYIAGPEMGRDIWICCTSSQFNTESVMEDLYYVFGHQLPEKTVG